MPAAAARCLSYEAGWSGIAAVAVAVAVDE
jgi:hypothetical protein